MSFITKTSSLLTIAAILIAYCMFTEAAAVKEAIKDPSYGRELISWFFDTFNTKILGIYRIVIRVVTGEPSTT